MDLPGTLTTAEGKLKYMSNKISWYKSDRLWLKTFQKLFRGIQHYVLETYHTRINTEMFIKHPFAARVADP